MLGSLFKLAGDVVKIAVAPVEIAVDVTRVFTKPVADMATDLTKEVKDGLKDLTQ